jgi:DNA polymerase I-like protein with 3'-5' exonuclease and polymerase domains
MKAKIIFKLPKESKEHLRCVKATDMASVLWEFARNSKKGLEWELESKKRDSFETLELVFERFYELMESNGVNIDELYE